MLAEAVAASPMPETHAPGFSATGISPCAYATYLNYRKLNPKEWGKKTHLVLEDGHEQEQAMLKQLARAGYEMWYVGNNQMELRIGKAKVPGHPDGLIWPPTYKLGQLEIKAMNEMRSNYFHRKGLEPKIKCQTQLYMRGWRDLGLDITETWVYVKDKESCMPEDRVEVFDPSYINPIIEATDEIILGNWVPTASKQSLCTVCRHSKYCWSGVLLDMTDAPNEEKEAAAVKQWFKGRAHKAEGKDLYDQARDYLAMVLEDSGDESMLFITEDEDVAMKIEAKKVYGETFKFNELLFAKEFGAQNLFKVMDRVPTEQIRTREVTK